MFLHARSHPWFALFLLLVLGPYLNAQGASPTAGRFHSPTSSAYIRQSDGAFITDDNQFEFAHVLHDDGSRYIRLLLLKNIHNEHIDGREETTGRIAVEAWTISRDNSRKPRWKFKVVGNDGEALYSDRLS
jgi:hypothetical protein